MKLRKRLDHNNERRATKCSNIVLGAENALPPCALQIVLLVHSLIADQTH